MIITLLLNAEKSLFLCMSMYCRSRPGYHFTTDKNEWWSRQRRMCTVRTNLHTACRNIRVYFRCVCGHRFFSILSRWGCMFPRTNFILNLIYLVTDVSYSILYFILNFILNSSIQFIGKYWRSFLLPTDASTASTGCLTAENPAAHSAMPVVPKKRSAVGTTEATGERNGLIYVDLFA